MILPIKDLGRAGVIRDVAPYNLPIVGWSNASNVRFENGRVRRSPGFRTINRDFTVDPAFAFGIRPSDGTDFVIYTDDSGNMYTYRAGHVNRTPASFAPNFNTALPFTGAVLDDCAYVNRRTDVPYVLARGSAEFQPLTDFNWPANDRAGVVRSFRDHLIFLDNQIGGVEQPTTVRWSDTVDGEGLPPSAFIADTTNNAGQNPLPDMQGRLVDGLPLKDRFMLYSTSEVWIMRATGDNSVFLFDKLYDDDGCIATNCVAQIDGVHYVFGEHDIYKTDGIDKVSILESQPGDTTNRDYIYSTMIKGNRRNFRVIRNQILDEIIFCYSANDADAAYGPGDYPNRAAVFNIKNSTWSFVDIPSICGWAELVLPNVATWDSVDTPWNQTGGSWNGSSDELRTTLFMVKRQDTTSDRLPAGNVLYAYDVIGEGSVVSEPLDTEVIPPAFVERVGIDLDEVGRETRDYKEVVAAFPQARAFDGANLRFTFGGSLYAWDNPTFIPELTFDPERQTKLDFRKGGRYLTVRLQVDEPQDFWFSGLDIDLRSSGRRG